MRTDCSADGNCRKNHISDKFSLQEFLNLENIKTAMESVMDDFESIPVYDNINPEIVSFYDNEKNVLDIGCGSGSLGGWIKEKNNKAVVYGVDVSPEAAKAARKKLDHFFLCDLNKKPLPSMDKKFDLIIMGDVLEHLVRPDVLLIDAAKGLKTGGHLIVSVPNIAHYGIRWRLLLGRFNYQDTGILDRTHLRFFTYKTITALFSDLGFTVVERKFIVSRGKWFSRFLYRFNAVQFVFKLEKK